MEFYSVTLIAKPGSKALAGDIVNKAARIVPFGKNADGDQTMIFAFAPADGDDAVEGDHDGRK